MMPRREDTVAWKCKRAHKSLFPASTRFSGGRTGRQDEGSPRGQRGPGLNLKPKVSKTETP